TTLTPGSSPSTKQAAARAQPQYHQLGIHKYQLPGTPVPEHRSQQTPLTNRPRTERAGHSSSARSYRQSETHARLITGEPLPELRRQQLAHACFFKNTSARQTTCTLSWCTMRLCVFLS